MHHLHTVLLVDDETTIRDGLKHMIRWEQEGFRLLGDAANGQEALTPDPAITARDRDHRFKNAANGRHPINNHHSTTIPIYPFSGIEQL